MSSKKCIYNVYTVFSLMYTYINVWARAPSVGTSDGARERERDIDVHICRVIHEKHTLEVDSSLLKVGF